MNIEFTANELNILMDGVLRQMGCQCPESAYWYCECDMENVIENALLKKLHTLK